jgi:CRISPR-associated protein Csb1
MKLDTLNNEPRLLLEAKLKPIAGTRFQPTGFPDLGAATYKVRKRLPDGREDVVEMLLVESAQSMANRREGVCWDDANQQPVAALAGLPYLESTLPDGSKTNSLLEAHRLNSPYIVNSPEFAEIGKAIGFEKHKPFDRRKLVQALFKYDPCSLLHGIFLEKIGGVVRLPRTLTAFIEAANVERAPYGGVKVDRVQPETTAKVTPYGKAKDGYGNVPYYREDFTGEITAYFVFDLALLRGIALPPGGYEFLVTLAAYKVRRFLTEGLKLRSGCDLELVSIQTTRPEKSQWVLPQLDALEPAIEKHLKSLTDEKQLGLSPLPVKYNTELAKRKAAAKEKEQKEQQEKDEQADSQKE